MIEISDHAFKQAHKRLSWNKSATQKMAEKAFTEGISHKDTKGTLRRYIDRIILSDKQYKRFYPNNIRVYGENLFMFMGSRLVTIYRLGNHRLVKSALNVR